MNPMQKLAASLTVGSALTCTAAAQAATTVTIATVNNSDMIVMEKLSSQFEAQNPDIKLHWVTLEENVLRQRVTTDIATHSGQLDLITVGVYEVPIWGKLGWLSPFTDIPASYKVDDLLSPIRNALTVDGKLDAVPFYGESTFTMYRTDLFRARNLTMPEHPTWTQIADLAGKINDPAHGVYGICLRGKPGWGENMGTIADMANSFGGRYFDMDWHPQLTSAPWRQAVELLRQAAARCRASRRGLERLQRDAGAVRQRQVRHVGRCDRLRELPEQPGHEQGRGQMSAMPRRRTRPPRSARIICGPGRWRCRRPRARRRRRSASRSGRRRRLTSSWSPRPRAGARCHPAPAPRPTRMPDYLKAAPYAPAVLQAMQTADPTHPVEQPVPYTGISYVGIPEWQDIGTDVGQQIAAAVSGQETVNDALRQAQADTERAMKQGGYLR